MPIYAFGITCLLYSLFFNLSGIGGIVKCLLLAWAISALVQMIVKKAYHMAEAMNIEPQHFHWYAAFHDTAHHPHVHIVMYSDNPKQGHLSTKGIDKMKTFFATDIFKEVLTDVYQQKEEVKKQLKSEISECLTQLKFVQESPVIHEQMMKLRESLKEHTGRKSYAYLSKELKTEVDQIMMEFEKIPEVQELLNKWKQLRVQQYEIYSDSKEPDFSIVHDKTFRPLKNMIIAFAANSDTIQSEIIKMQLSGAKSKEMNQNDEPLLTTTGFLIRSLSKIIQKSTKTHLSSVQSDKMQRIKEKQLKMALGQNEKDTQQFS